LVTASALTLGLALGIAIPAFAEESSVRTEVKAAIEVKKADIKAQQDELKNTVKALEARQKEVRASTSAAIKEKREDIKDLRASTTDKMKEVHKDQKDERKEIRFDMVKLRIATVTRVLSATVKRLEMISERIQSRITKIAATGQSATEAQASVDAAKVNLADAKAQIAIITSLSSSTGTTTSTTTIAANIEAAKVAGDKAKSALKSAHENLMKAVRFIGGLHLGEDKPHATTTATTTTSN